MNDQLRVPPRRRVIVGVDGSPDSSDALDWAIDQAGFLDAVLEVVHVRFMAERAGKFFAEAEETERSILDRAEAQVRDRAPAVEVITILADPPTAKFLIDRSRDAELLVVGSRGLGGFKELALGSVSQQCAHHAHCPVVVVRHRDQGPS